MVSITFLKYNVHVNKTNQQQKQKAGPHKQPQQKSANPGQQTGDKNYKKPYSRAHLSDQAEEQATPPEATQPDHADLAQKVEDLKDVVLQLLEIIKGLVPPETFNAILSKNKSSVVAPSTMMPC